MASHFQLLITILLSFLTSPSQCNIINAAANQYRGGTITCIENEDCYINCSEQDACKNAEIICPMDHQCGITCNADNACQDSLIIATYSSLFILTCKDGNDYTCSGLSIYFPPNDANGIPLGILHVGNNLNSLSNQLQFYAMNGWNDVDTTHYTGNYAVGHHEGIMHCSSTYALQCPFASDKWQCPDAQSPCNNYTNINSNAQSLNSLVFKL